MCHSPGFIFSPFYPWPASPLSPWTFFMVSMLFHLRIALTFSFSYAIQLDWKEQEYFIITTKLILYPVLNQWLILPVLPTTHTWTFLDFEIVIFFLNLHISQKAFYDSQGQRPWWKHPFFFFFLPRELSTFISYRRCLENTCRHKIRMTVRKIKILLLALCSI